MALRDLGLPIAAFAVVTALAELLGAANLGTAMTFGQVAFMAAVVAVMLIPAKRSEKPAG